MADNRKIDSPNRAGIFIFAMRRTIALFIFAFIAAALAEDPLQKPILEPEQSASVAKKSLRVMLAKSENGEPTTKFLSNQPKIHAYWKGRGLEAGDRVGIRWLVEDVGLGQKESEITGASATVYKSDDKGSFALARPADGWPLGKYRCEVYLSGKIQASIDFTIEKGAEIEVH